jgi:hypothetical protein
MGFINLRKTFIGRNVRNYLEIFFEEAIFLKKIKKTKVQIEEVKDSFYISIC